MVSDTTKVDDRGEREQEQRTLQLAIGMWHHDDANAWASYNAMLVANSLVVAAIAVLLSGDLEIPMLNVGLPLIGLIICSLWLLTHERHFTYRQYWIDTAREMEQRSLSPSCRVVSRAGLLDDGGVKVDIGPGDERHHSFSRWGASLPRVRSLMAATGWVFIILYTLILCTFVPFQTGGTILETIIVSVASLALGAVVTWAVARWYFNKSSGQLTKIARNLQDSLNALATFSEQIPEGQSTREILLSFRRSQNGDVVGVNATVRAPTATATVPEEALAAFRGQVAQEGH
ncbi:MAG: RipA family octameric membrane protein [Chloroflexota bacterium]